MFSRKNLLLITSLAVLLGCVSKTQGVKNGSIHQLSKQEKKEGYKALFNGLSLDQWIDPSNEYYTENGSIVKRLKGHGNLYTKKQYDNFILRFEFLLPPAGNNGLGIRHKLVTNKTGYDGMELQILDSEHPQYKNLKPYQYHGSLYGYVPAKRGFLKPAGEWNVQEVTANGTKIKILLNGNEILNTDMSDIPKDEASQKLFYPKGHIVFLGHDDAVKFRKIRIKEL